MLSITGSAGGASPLDVERLWLHVGGFNGGSGTYLLTGGDPPLHSIAGYSQGHLLDAYGTIPDNPAESLDALGLPELVMVGGRMHTFSSSARPAGK